jgi:hypothetical protein
MKIYLLEAGHGWDEEAVNSILGVYFSDKDADKESDRYCDLIKSYSEAECPVNKDSVGSLNDEEWNKYRDWVDNHNLAYSFNGCHITSFEIKGSPWVKVSEDLPEHNREVLIKTDHGAIFNGLFNGTCWMQMDGAHGSSYVQIDKEWEVIEWMELIK